MSSIAVVGSVAAAATCGALVAIGHRLGDAGWPFAAIADALLHRSSLGGGIAAVVIVGVLIHVAMTFVWAAVFLWLITYARMRDWIAGLAVAVGQLMLSWLVAVATGSGMATVLAFGDRAIVAVVLGIALVVGMRFASPASQNAMTN